MPGKALLFLAVSVLGPILAGCAAPTRPPWLPEPMLPAPGEGWDAGYGAGPATAEIGGSAEGRKSIQDPDAFLWRGSAWVWKPATSGEGTFRGTPADGVDAGGEGGGISVGLRHRYVRGAPSSRSAEGYSLSPTGPEWPVYFGADFASFGCRADSGGDTGRLGAVDAFFVLGTAHFPSGGKRPDFLVEALFGLRRASLKIEGDELSAASAEENYQRVGVAGGLNLEAPLGEVFSVFGHLDGSAGGTSDSDSHSTVHAFAGIRAALGNHLSLEGGWRYFRAEVTRRETNYGVFIIFPYSETVKVSDASLKASGPWIGLVYDF